MVQAGEDMGDIFSPHFTPLPVAYNFHAFKVTVYSSSDSGHKAKFILNLFLAHDSEFTALKRPNKQQIKPVEHLSDVAEEEIHIMALQHLCYALKSVWTKLSQQCLQHLVESML